jgi:hypothetical protein
MDSQPAQSFGIIETISKAVSFLAMGISAIGALLQYQANSEAESRMRSQAELETDIKVSSLFSTLIEKANGRGSYSKPSEPVINKLFSRIPEKKV